MRRTTVWTVAVIAGIGLFAMAAGPVIVHGVFRYYMVQKILGLFPDERQRLAVLPQKKMLTAPPATEAVNLGYATFDMGTTGAIYIAAVDDGAAVAVTNDDLGIEFMPPYLPEALTDTSISSAMIEADAKAGSSLARYVEVARTNVVAAEIELEETRLLPISQIALMSSEDFRLYAVKLVRKAGLFWGSNEIWWFITPRVQGIVRVGEGPNDRQRAQVILTSLDGTRNLAIQAILPHGSSKDIMVALDPILASFQFTIDKVNDRNEIRRLILQAGIPMRLVN
jgi:hypothetical protein